MVLYLDLSSFKKLTPKKNVKHVLLLAINSVSRDLTQGEVNVALKNLA